MESDFAAYLMKTVDISMKYAVVFDSMSNLILHRGTSYTCQVFQRCTNLKQGKDASFSPVTALLQSLISVHLIVQVSLDPVTFFTRSHLER